MGGVFGFDAIRTGLVPERVRRQTFGVRGIKSAPNRVRHPTETLTGEPRMFRSIAKAGPVWAGK